MDFKARQDTTAAPTRPALLNSGREAADDPLRDADGLAAHTTAVPADEPVLAAAGPAPHPDQGAPGGATATHRRPARTAVGAPGPGAAPALADSAAEARRAYDAFAASYDDFNHRYMFERWTGRLLEVAMAAGLGEGRRLLDVGCGTGLSFLPMLDRGWEVTACDISPAMVARARRRAGGRARLLTADMRTLPRLGEFDLVWAVNDAINYLRDEAELAAALAGMRANLAPGGIVVFDVNTLAAYRGFFSAEHVVERGGRSFVWRGQVDPDALAPGALCEARFDGDGEGVEPHVHVQRHFPPAEVLGAIEAAGLRCVSSAGELDGDLHPRLDEDRHTKAVYACAAASPSD